MENETVELIPHACADDEACLSTVSDLISNIHEPLNARILFQCKTLHFSVR